MRWPKDSGTRGQSNSLPYANSAETGAKVVAAPSADEIALEMGYEDAKDRKRLDPVYRMGKKKA